jgi:hypothetical protein
MEDPMTTITHIDAARRLLSAAHEGRLIAGAWHREEDGRNLACMIGSMGNGVRIDAPDKCPATVMVPWLVHVVVRLFDAQTPEDRLAWAIRFGTQMEHPAWLTASDSVRAEFQCACIDAALDAARPCNEGKDYWPRVEAACRGVQRALRGDGDLAAAGREAWSARAAAAGRSRVFARLATSLCDLIDVALAKAAQP